MPRNTTDKHANQLPAFWPDSELHRRLRQITKAINRPHTAAEHNELTEIAKDLKAEIKARLFY